MPSIAAAVTVTAAVNGGCGFSRLTAAVTVVATYRRIKVIIWKDQYRIGNAAAASLEG